MTAVVGSAGLWVMVAMSVWAQSLLQHAFRHANAATVSATNASVASLGLIGAGFALYREPFPGGGSGLALAGGVVVSLVGTAFLLRARPAQGPVPRTAARSPSAALGSLPAGGDDLAL
jgi:hypothetical protein